MPGKKPNFRKMEALLVIHIIGGATALLSGTLAMVLRKGGPWHITVGRTFGSAMLICSVAGMLLAQQINSQFLAVVGVFSLYLTGSGWLALRVPRNEKLRPMAYGLALVMLLTAGVFIGSGVSRFAHGGFIQVVFGGIGLFLAVQDFRAYRYRKGHPVRLHIGRMVGAWIAALSAFLVVNHVFGIPWLNWLLPTLVGVPFIIAATRKFIPRT